MPEAPPERTIMIVDHDLDVLEWATRHLAAKDLRILRCDNPDKALKVFEKTHVDLVLAEIRTEPIDGLELLARIRQQHPACIVILITGFPSTNQIIEATQRGAHDILRKESLTFELRPVVEAALQTIDDRRAADHSESKLPATEGRVKMIGVSRSIQEVFKLVGRVA